MVATRIFFEGSNLFGEDFHFDILSDGLKPPTRFLNGRSTPSERMLVRPIPAQGGDIVSFPQKCLKNSGLACFLNLPTSIFCKVWEFHGIKL